MPKIIIVKSNGDKEILKPGKIINALKRSGASDDLAESITKKIETTAWSGITTREIYHIAKQLLRKTSPALAARYSLRDAIFRLGPAGFEFEKYMMLLFRTYGYKTELPEILEGKCITHEVDILARKDSKTIIMECKLRHSTNIYIGIKDTMSTWARFMDLKDGAKLGRCPKIDEVWLVTNSRFSYDSQKYGACKKMGMLSWNTPAERPLPQWIDQKKLYPVTVLHSVKNYHLKVFSNIDLLLLKDVVKYSQKELSRMTGFSPQQINPIINEAREVLDFNPKNNL